jgi:hypothetical protein
MTNCTEDSGHETDAKREAADGFASKSDALNALAAALLRQIEADRKDAGKDCSARTCDGNGICATAISNAELPGLEAAIYVYSVGGASRWGYDFAARRVVSGCRCATAPRKEERDVPESFKAYEDGKHRRYSLLFAVNGGAFAVAKLFSDPQNANVLGSLTLRELSLGMILFTIVMVVDIFMFGEKMRAKYLPDDFGWQGKAVLLLLGVLICGGWFLVGRFAA